MKSLALLAALLLPLMGELRNTMPSKSLQAFKERADARAIRYANYIQEIPTEKKLLYLSFDDGPDARITPELLKLLKKRGVRANFFFLGEGIRRYPEVVKEAHEAGHRIFSHGMEHRDFRTLESATLWSRQIAPVQEAIKELLGEVYPCIRPPYGALTPTQIELLASHGMSAVLWSIDSFDWMRSRSAEAVVAEVRRYLHPGAIILMHSGSANAKSLDAVDGVIDAARQAGYRFELLSPPLAK